MKEHNIIRPLGKYEKLFAINHEGTNDYIHFLKNDEKGNAHYGLRPGREGSALWKGIKSAVNMLKFFEEHYRDKTLKLEPIHKNT